jgi:hypothetical protein
MPGERRTPRRLDVRDFVSHRFIERQRRQHTREIHRQSFAQGEEARMHLGGMGAGQRTRGGILGPQTRRAMTLGQCFADGETVEDHRFPAGFGDLQNR